MNIKFAINLTESEFIDSKKWRKKETNFNKKKT